jgi:uncharacterized protein involved in exopolysaccharide biosynthesis
MPKQLQIVPMRPVHSPTLRDVAAVFFRHKRLLITCFTVFAVTGILYSTLFPSYESQMKVLIRRGSIDPVITPTPSPSPAFEHDEITEEELNSEVELLTDEDILRQVVLATDLAKPTWKSRLLGETSEQRTQKAVQRLAKQLDIKPIRKSRLIAISYRSSDSARSAAVLQALSRTYLTKHAELHRPRGQQTFFEQQMKQARQELEHAQANLIAFTHNAGVESAGLQRDLTLQKLSEAEANELALISDMAEASERVQSLRTQLRTLAEQRVVQVKHADNPESLGKMKTALLQLQLRRTELLTKFQPSYRLVQEVDQQIAQAKASIEAEELTPLRDETTEQNPEYTWAHSDLLKTRSSWPDCSRKRQCNEGRLRNIVPKQNRSEKKPLCNTISNKTCTPPKKNGCSIPANARSRVSAMLLTKMGCGMWPSRRNRGRRQFRFGHFGALHASLFWARSGSAPASCLSKIIWTHASAHPMKCSRLSEPLFWLRSRRVAQA